MCSQWKDYQYGSWLVLVFGVISAKVDVLGVDKDGKENHFGIITFPSVGPRVLGPGEMPGAKDPTRCDAKHLAELLVRDFIMEASRKLEE